MNALDVATLKFPLLWHSRLIVMAESSIVDEEAIRAVFLNFGLTAENVVRCGASNNGKYVSWHLSCRMPDNVVFRAAIRALQDLPGFVMLL